jgi:hypothetical protein
MTSGTTQRRIFWHAFFTLMLAFAFGVVMAAQGPKGRSWLPIHLAALMEFLLLGATGAAWPFLRLGERASGAAFWFALVQNYAGIVGGSLTGVFGFPSALEGMSAWPHDWRTPVIVPILAVGDILAIGFAGLMIYGLWGSTAEVPPRGP